MCVCVCVFEVSKIKWVECRLQRILAQTECSLKDYSYGWASDAKCIYDKIMLESAKSSVFRELQ